MLPRAVDEPGRKDKLETLLARVRERGSGLHRAVRPDDGERREHDRATWAPEPPSVGTASARSSARQPTIGSIDLGALGPGPLVEDDELDRIASRRTLERYVEASLGDDEPSVPFAEEGPGWEAEPLALDAGEAPGIVGAVWPPEDPAAAAHEAMFGTSARDDAASTEGPLEARPPSSRRPQHLEPSGLPRPETLAELPPMPFSPFPSDRPPKPMPARPPMPTPAEGMLEGFEDLEPAGPKALPLDVPWETLAKQLRGRRRSGEFQLTEAHRADSKRSAGTPEATEPAAFGPAAPRERAQAAEEPPASSGAEQLAPPTEPSVRARDGSPPPERDPEPGPRTEDEAGELVAEAATEPPTDPPAPASASSRPAADAPVGRRRYVEPADDEDVLGPPSRSMGRRARRARLGKKRGSGAWLPLGAVALALIVLAWWSTSGRAGRAPGPPTSGGRTPTALASPPGETGAAPRATTPRVIREAPPPPAATPTAREASGTVASATTVAAAGDTPPAEPLGESEGWLRVSGRRFSVYLNGGLAGSTGQWIRTGCGVRHLRLAHVDPPPRGRSFPWWVDDGGPVVVPCRGATTVEVDPGGFR